MKPDPDSSERELGPRPPGVLASLPRRAFLKTRIGETTPPQMKAVTFKASRSKAFLRLLLWLDILVQFGTEVLWDTCKRINSPKRRASHLRRIFEERGGTVVKLGRHLALRVDLLRWEYGIEFAGMVDRMPAFPQAEAIAMIERASGRALAETFSRFDPNPVVSNSVSCIYQAFLCNGERVVVKVRRPGIGELFMADLNAFEWLGRTMGLFILMRPGYVQKMIRELREGLVEELDFVREARYMDLFRRGAGKSGKRFFSAPRVYFELSGADVLVQEFIVGMWLAEVIAAVELKDAEGLAVARGLNIQPEQIARRLTWIQYWSWHEHFFFRADPDPDRIIVAKDGKLFFIEFGSVGSIDRTRRRALDQNMNYAWKKDPLNMARASLVLLEPLPPLDPFELTTELEACNRQMLFAFEASQSNQKWFARTGAQQWVGLIDVARRARIAIDFQVLRLLRSNVMYDTLAVRLDPGINVIKEYRRFTGYLARRAERRLSEKFNAQARDLPDRNPIYLELERLANIGENLFFRLRHVLSTPRVNFHVMTGKGSFIVYTGIRLGVQLLGLAALMAAGVAIFQLAMTDQLIEIGEAFNRVFAMAGFRIVAGVLVLLNTRKALFRMDDKDS